LLHKLDAAEQQHEVGHGCYFVCLVFIAFLLSLPLIFFKADEKFQRKLEGKSNKDRTNRIGDSEGLRER